MKWIVGILIIFDCIYQLFGISTSVNWSIYYDVLNSGGIAAILLFYAYKRVDYLIGIFGIYFLIIALNNLSFLGMERQEFLNISRTPTINIYSIIAIILLTTFILFKKWRN